MNAPLIDRFCDHLWLEDGLADATLAAYRRDLNGFAGWLLKARACPLQDAVAGDIEAWLSWRFARRTQPRSAARYTSALKRFYRFLLRERLIEADPTRNLDRPALPRALPKTLTEADVEQLLAAAGDDTPASLRDRAMLETLYATGLRVSELVSLKLTALSLNDGVLRVVAGKGNKDRLVPLGEEAVRWLGRYLNEARPLLLGAKRSPLRRSTSPPSRPRIAMGLHPGQPANGPQRSLCMAQRSPISRRARAAFRPKTRTCAATPPCNTPAATSALAWSLWLRTRAPARRCRCTGPG